MSRNFLPDLNIDTIVDPQYYFATSASDFHWVRPGLNAKFGSLEAAPPLSAGSKDGIEILPSSLGLFPGTISSFPNLKLRSNGQFFSQIPSGSRLQAVGDFNGDSSTDLFSRDPATGQSSIWCMGYFGGALYQMGSEP
jgi:hypothetical protein